MREMCRRTSRLFSSTSSPWLRQSLALELRAAIDGNGGTGDPPCTVGRDKSDDIGDILRLADALQRLHAQRDLASRFGLREVRHIRVDDAGCDGVDAYAARPQDGGPVFHQRLDRSLG